MAHEEYHTDENACTCKEVCTCPAQGSRSAKKNMNPFSKITLPPFGGVAPHNSRMSLRPGQKATRPPPVPRPRPMQAPQTREQSQEAEMKYSKQDARYGPVSEGETRCGDCSHFISGQRGASGKCQIVQGSIDPDATCDYAEPRGPEYDRQDYRMDQV